MIKFSHAWVAVILMLTACEKSERVTPNGFKYTVVKAGKKELPKKGEILVFDFELRDSKDSLWNDSYKEGMPAAMEVKDTSELKGQDGITQMLGQLGVGDSVKATMTVPEFFKSLVRRPVPAGIDSTRSLTYTIHVRDAMAYENFLKWRNGLVETKEEKMIQDYVKANNLNAVRDSSGLYVVKYTNNNGPKPTATSCVEVKYEGKFLKNGRRFDGNPKIAFSLQQVIRAWQIGFPMLSKGDSATFIIPSRIGYGPEGYYGIPPDAVLLFNVTLFDFKNSFDPATRQCK